MLRYGTPWPYLTLGRPITILLIVLSRLSGKYPSNPLVRDLKEKSVLFDECASELGACSGGGISCIDSMLRSSLYAYSQNGSQILASQF